MKVFFATTTKLTKIGGLQECLIWAHARIQAKEAKIVKIFRARPDNINARIIGEVTKDGHFATNGGRQVPLSLLKKALKNGKKA